MIIPPHRYLRLPPSTRRQLSGSGNSLCREEAQSPTCSLPCLRETPGDQGGDDAFDLLNVDRALCFLAALLVHLVPFLHAIGVFALDEGAVEMLGHVDDAGPDGLARRGSLEGVAGRRDPP